LGLKDPPKGKKKDRFQRPKSGLIIDRPGRPRRTHGNGG